MFFMGLFLGLAVSAIAALSLILNFMWNGKSLGALGGTPSVAAVAPSPSANPQPSQPSAPPAGPVKPVAANDHQIGNKNAKVTLIEYSDFECPFCKRHEDSIQQALREFPKDVRLVYRHYPLTSIHANAEKAAEGSECATKLGGEQAFWKMHDKIFQKSPDIGPDALVALAKEIGLNETAFKSCLTSGEMKARVDADAATGNDAGVEGTPATYINGKLISGAIPYASLKTALQAAGAKQ